MLLIATHYLNTLRAALGREEGATMVEYGLMVALIAIVAMVGAAALGWNVLDVFNETADAVDGGITTVAPAGG